MNIIYHWWHEEGDPPPYANLRSPLILSIATARAHHPDAKIFVLDGSKGHVDWGDFPGKLNFIRMPLPHSLGKSYKHRPGWKHLSRLFDLDLFQTTYDGQFDGPVAYQDVDVFWLRSMEPFSGDLSRFTFDKHNSGFFYYNPQAEPLKRFYEVFKAYTITALNDDSFRALHRQYVNYNQWYYVLDETMLTYMWHKHPDLFHIFSQEEHVRGGNIGQLLNGGRMLHFNGIMVRNPITKHASQREHCRGLACLLLKELYESVRLVLDDKDLEKIFTEEERAGYFPMQQSIRDPIFVKKLADTRNETGHLDLFSACNSLSDL